MDVRISELMKIAKVSTKRFDESHLSDILEISWEDAHKAIEGEDIMITATRFDVVKFAGRLAEASYMNCPRPLGTFKTRLYNAESVMSHACRRAREAFPI